LGPYDYVLRHGVAVLTARSADDEESGVRVGAVVPARVPDRPTARAGLNRCALDLLYPAARTVPNYLPYGVTSPLAPPGTYAVRIMVGEMSLTAPCEIVADPRATATREELQAQFDLLRGVRDAVTALHEAVAVARDLRRQLEAWRELPGRDAAASAIRDEAARIAGRLRDLENAIVQPAYTERSGELSASHYRLALSHRLEALGSALAGYDGPPTAPATALYTELTGRVDGCLDELRAVLAGELPAFNGLVRETGLSAVRPFLQGAGATASERSAQ
jgi:hypothetical protein